MARATDRSRDLIFGLLALQNGLIDREALFAAFRSWASDKATPLSDHLVARGDLDTEDRTGIDVLVDLHIKRHGDARKSLAAVSVEDSTREGLAALADSDLDATLSHVGSGSTQTDDDGTHTYRGGPASADGAAASRVGTAPPDGRRFRVLRPHASGGLGAVFVAVDEELNREVALKQILDRHADDPVSRQRFVLEAEITGGLEHPGIVPVYGLGTFADGRPYYAMRFIRGESLREAIAAFHEDRSLESDLGRRSLEFRKLLRRFTDVCNAIEYAHNRGVLHRDLKPGNVIVGKYGETLVVDWGLAKATGKADPSSFEKSLTPSAASGSSDTLAGSVLGTPSYMSPEQARGDLAALGPASDVYSLGATLYCLLTGRPPFENGDLREMLQAVDRGNFPLPRKLDPTITRSIEAVCLKAMAREPADRYPTARALAGEIDRWLADEPVEAYREPRADRAARWARHHRTAVTSAAALLLTALAALSVGSVLIWREQQHTAVAKEQADDERTKAVAARERADLERDRAETEKTRAETEKSRAEANLGLAWGLAADLGRVVDLNETGRATASLAERESLLQTVLQASEKVLAARPDDRELKVRTARLLRFAANLGRFLGRPKEAGDAYDRSIALYEELAREDPSQRDPLSQTLRDHAVFLTGRGQLSQAEPKIRRAIDLAKQGEADEPGRQAWPLAVALLELAEIESILGRHTDAEQTASRARRLLDELLAPGQPPAHHLAPLFQAMAAIRQAIIRREGAAAGVEGFTIEAALATHDESVEQFRTLFEADEGIDVVHNLSRALTERARTGMDRPDQREQAAADLDEAIRRWEGLVKQNPQVPLYREWLATSLMLRSRLRTRTGTPAETGQDLAAAIGRLETLSKADPQRGSYRGLLGEVWVERARIAADEAARRDAVDKAMSSFRAARNRDPENLRYTRLLDEVRREWPAEAKWSDEKRQAAGPRP